MKWNFFYDFTYRNVCWMDSIISAVQSVSCSIKLSNLKKKKWASSEWETERKLNDEIRVKDGK